MGHWAVGLHIWHEHGFIRAQDFRALSHKFDAAEQDDLFTGLCCFFAEQVGISHIISYILDVTGHVIVCQNHDILFLFEL